MKTTRRMPSFESVSGGATATLRMPIGLTYHQLLINYSGITLAQMDEIRLIANGQLVRRYTSGEQLDNINQFQGRAAANGILIFDFERYGLNTRAARELTAFGTGVEQDPQRVTTLTLEIDINSAATSPVLSAEAIQSNATVLGAINLVRNFSYNAPSVGEYEISDLPKGNLINQARFENANISKIKVERNNYIIFERSKAENDLIQSDGKRVPTAAAYVIDPTEVGDGAEGLATRNVQGQVVQDLRFVLTMSAAGDVPLCVDYIGGLSG
ncbi:MAG: major capsid protein P2 [Flavobacteriales bacterium]